MNEELIKKMLRLWDPYDLFMFPEDEYDSYAIKIFAYINEMRVLNVEELAKFTYTILHNGMKVIGKKEEYIEIQRLNIFGCKKFAELLLSIKLLME